MNNENSKYSMTIEELAKRLESYQQKNGNGGYPKTDNKDWKDGYARAITDILWIIA